MSSRRSDSELKPYSMNKRLGQLELIVSATEREVKNLVGILQQQEDELSCTKGDLKMLNESLFKRKKIYSPGKA